MTAKPTNQTFSSMGTMYEVLPFGVIHQMNPQPFTYDEKYVSVYDTEKYKRDSDTLQALRFGFVTGVLGCMPDSLLDFGYGNGAFLKFVNMKVPWTFGYDISGVELPSSTIERVEDISKMPNVDVITFWDALEHVHDLSFLKDIKAQVICLSLPYCHWGTKGMDWFDNDYRHRKPDEHIWHFNKTSIQMFMKEMGWQMVAYSNMEDIVRVNKKEDWNILTAGFNRIQQ